MMEKKKRKKKKETVRLLEVSIFDKLNYWRRRHMNYIECTYVGWDLMLIFLN